MYGDPVHGTACRNTDDFPGPGGTYRSLNATTRKGMSFPSCAGGDSDLALDRARDSSMCIPPQRRQEFLGPSVQNALFAGVEPELDAGDQSLMVDPAGIRCFVKAVDIPKDRASVEQKPVRQLF